MRVKGCSHAIKDSGSHLVPMGFSLLVYVEIPSLTEPPVEDGNVVPVVAWAEFFILLSCKSCRSLIGWSKPSTIGEIFSFILETNILTHP